MDFVSLYQELTLSTEMIRSLLAGIEDKLAREKPDEDNWSILEVVCHLYNEEREDFREHLDIILHRHIRQIVELRRKRIEKITQPFQIDYAGNW